MKRVSIVVNNYVIFEGLWTGSVENRRHMLELLQDAFADVVDGSLPPFISGGGDVDERIEVRVSRVS